MDTTASALTLTLGRAQFLRLPQPEGLCLQVQSGTLWITRDGQPEDLELGAGERLCLQGQAAVVIGTLGGAAHFRAERAGRAGATRPVALAWA